MFIINFFIKENDMSVITDAVVEAIKKVKNDANVLSDAEIAQITPIIEQKVAEAKADLQAKVDSNEADLKKIADALVDPSLPAEETVSAIGEILDVEPVT